MNPKQLVILALLGVISMSKLSKVIELSTPGAKAPEVIYDFAKNPEDNFKIPNHVTPLGMRQQYLVGHELRSRYVLDEAFMNTSYPIQEMWL